MHATQWRANVLYVRQSGGQGLQGTPKELLTELCALKSQTRRRLVHNENNKSEDVVETLLLGVLEENLKALDLPHDMMDQRWDFMSGGEAQRVYLCVLLALGPSVLLLDEPTSACDEQAAGKVEKLIVDSRVAAVWVSHDAAQMERLEQFNQTSFMTFQTTAVTG
jgi:ABC-type phosphate transport system ATPase subunit